MANPWAIIITLVAWLGHAFAWTVLLNFVYSFPIHRRLQRGFRMLVGIMALALPLPLYPWLRQLDLADFALWEWCGIGYMVGCCSTALLVLPVVTVMRMVRRDAAAVLRRDARIHDIAEDFASRPLGFGKHWQLARLPGNQLLQVEFTELTLRLPRLPAAWDGLTILHISDLHFHGTPEKAFFDKVIDRALDWGTPDLVCVTGDLVDTVQHEGWIKPVLGRLKWREAGLAILGNHDFWTDPPGVRRELGRAGFTVLGNTHQEMMIRGEPLLAIGDEGPWFHPGPDLSNAPAAGFRLLLSHTPDNIGWARRNRVDLMLSGHVHGGQVRVPVLGSLFVPSRYSRRYDQGVFFESPTMLCVTRGVSGREPLRWNCRPEVNWYRLVR